MVLVGRQNGAYIEQSRHRKNYEKKKGSKIAKKLEKVPATRCGGRSPEPRGGDREGKPIPKGEGALGRGTKTR